MSLLKNPEPIFKQRKSEMNTNPLIIGEMNEIQEEKNVNKEILIDANRQFTETIEDLCYELYYNKRIMKMTRIRLKWILIMIVVFIIIYFLIKN